MTTRFGFERTKGGASMVGAVSIRRERKLASPVIAGGDLKLGGVLKLDLAPGTYWARYVITVVENLNGKFGFRLTIDGNERHSDSGDVNNTDDPNDFALLRLWIQFTAA